jgi:hypothetical protein
MSGTRPANYHRIKPAGDSAGQALNRLFERHRIDPKIAAAIAAIG